MPLLQTSQSSSALGGLLHSELWCGQSTASAFRQSSSSGCAVTVSAPDGPVVVGLSLLLARLSDGLNCSFLRSALTVSDVCWRLVCFLSTDTYSTLEVLHILCYINLRLTYLLTYFEGLFDGGAENAERENDGREIDGPICRAWNYRTWKCRNEIAGHKRAHKRRTFEAE